MDNKYIAYRARRLSKKSGLPYEEALKAIKEEEFNLRTKNAKRKAKSKELKEMRKALNREKLKRQKNQKLKKKPNVFVRFVQGGSPGLKS